MTIGEIGEIGEGGIIDGSTAGAPLLVFDHHYWLIKSSRRKTNYRRRKEEIRERERNPRRVNRKKKWKKEKQETLTSRESGWENVKKKSSWWQWWGVIRFLRNGCTVEPLLTDSPRSGQHPRNKPRKHRFISAFIKTLLAPVLTTNILEVQKRPQDQFTPTVQATHRYQAHPLLKDYSWPYYT